MDREALSNGKPRWLELENRPSHEKLRQCVRYVESIIGAIGAERREPDVLEAKHLAYAIHAIVEERYFAALTYAEMAVMEPASCGPQRLLPAGPGPVQLAVLQDALVAVKSKLVPRG